MGGLYILTYTAFYILSCFTQRPSHMQRHTHTYTYIHIIYALSARFESYKRVNNCTLNIVSVLVDIEKRKRGQRYSLCI